MSMPSSKLIQLLDFEVFGRVQGVFFRKYTKKTCDKHHVTGWIINTAHGTVQGTIEGTPQNVAIVKQWITTQGSPSSRIEKAEFFNERQNSSKTFDSFKVIRNSAEVARKTFKR
ncbi:acylphosphatase-1-like [Styela clava]